MSDPSVRPTHIRYYIILVAMFAAVLLYLERVCLSVADSYVREDLGISRFQMDLAFGAFFVAYALGQVPSGWLSQRYGPRVMMALYMLGWSVFGVFIAFAQDFVTLFIARFLLGVSQAGAYPTAALVVKRWVPDRSRGFASSVVAFGGRFGGAGATWLTGLLIVAFVPMDTSATVDGKAVLNPATFGQALCQPQNPGPFDSVRAQIRERVTATPGPEQLSAMGLGGGPAVFFSIPPSRVESIVNEEIRGPSLIEKSGTADVSAVREKLAFDGQAILDKPPSVRTPQESERLNRLVIEKTVPGSIRQIHGEGWRPTLALYGILGIGMGGLFWVVARNWPREHPWANQAEVDLIETGQAKLPESASDAIPWRNLTASRNQWFFSVNQFFANVGWVFLITQLPRFLKEAYNQPVDRIGFMNTIILFVAAFGMLAGGWFTDRLSRNRGKRWGRSIPAGAFKLPCAIALACVPFLPGVWWVVAALAVMSICQDFGVPSAWAFAQDTGGKQAATVLGWANMWGNLGAGIAPPLMGLIAVAGGWEPVMFAGAAAFVMSGIFGMLMRADVPLFSGEVVR